MNKRLEELREQITRHDRLYYKEAQPEISDQQYDLLKREFEDLSANLDPLRLFKLSEETHGKSFAVGDDRLDEFESYEHAQPMLSLDNTYDRQELMDFDSRLKRVIGESDLKFVVEPKIDGVAVSLTYHDGKLIRAVTRGNGVEGDVITQNLMHIESLPHFIHESTFPSAVELRGEIYMEHSEFLRINEKRKMEGKSLYANPRNLAAGTVKLLDPKESRSRKLAITLYGLGHCEPVGHYQSLTFFHQTLKELNFPVVDYFREVESIEEAWLAIEEINERRNSYPYPTDGAVVKLNSMKLQEKAGFTAKSPRWAISYKFEAERQKTILEDISVQVGRTGAITPVAHLKPVQLAGTLVSRASLHNADEIRRKDIRIGDVVIVEKAGEIIPQVVGVDKDSRPSALPVYSFPSECPSCHSLLVRSEGEAAWRCANNICPDQLKGRIKYVASRGCLDIENLGEAVVDQLVDVGLVRRLDDLYRLEVEHIESLEGFAEKSAQNLIQAIKESKDCDFWRILCGLGIKHIGTSASKDLARKFSDWKDLTKASKEEFLEIDGIGEIMAESLISFFENEANINLLESLDQMGVAMVGAVGSSTKSPWLNQTFVLTGALQKFSRQEAGLKIEELGGRVSGSVSSKTNYLVAGPGAGSKLKKAQGLDIKILNEDDFISFLENPFGSND